MTVTQYVINWLKGYDPAMDISTDQILPNNDANGLIKTPSDSTRTDILGNKTVTSFLRFYCTRASVNDAQRVANQQWLEALQEWADEHGSPSDAFPKGTLESIGISSTFGLATQSATNTIYQITIQITYRKDA